MTKPSSQDIIAVLLDLHGRTFADEIGIDLDSGSPAALFQMLTATLLFSVRISERIAVAGARELFRHGWTTPARMLRSTWAERVRALDDVKYVRYDESRSRMLEEMAREVQDRYGGDLNNLRKAAGRDPKKERALLKEFKGIGDVGVNIFFREAQVAWTELFPFIDERTQKAARKLGLPTYPDELVYLSGRRNFVRMTAALIRVDLKKSYGEITAKARELVRA